MNRTKCYVGFPSRSSSRSSCSVPGHGNSSSPQSVRIVLVLTRLMRIVSHFACLLHFFEKKQLTSHENIDFTRLHICDSVATFSFYEMAIVRFRETCFYFATLHICGFVKMCLFLGIAHLRCRKTNVYFTRS